MTGCNLSRVEKTGEAELPLHYGKAPDWLLSRMRRLAENIVVLIIDEYGGMSCYGSCQIPAGSRRSAVSWDMTGIPRVSPLLT
jgi:hypothetical protein